MQKLAVLGGKEEDETIDETQQLLEVALTRECPFCQRLPERSVGLVLDKPLPQLDERRFDAAPQLVASSNAFNPAGVAPCLKRRVGRRRLGLAKAALVDQEPQSRKVGKQAFGENLGKVGL